jgi:hypothetical protein
MVPITGKDIPPEFSSKYAHQWPIMKAAAIINPEFKPESIRALQMESHQRH